MAQSHSIQFQAQRELTGAAKDVFAELMDRRGAQQGVRGETSVVPVELPVSQEEERLTRRNLRQRLRKLEKERSLLTTDGVATWLLTDDLSVDSDLGERINNIIVGEGLGTGRIIFGPHDFCLAPGYYMATIEFQITNMCDVRRVKVIGEVSLNNRRYLSQQSKAISSTGSYLFRLPFRIKEQVILDHMSPAIEVRFNLKGVVGVAVTQVAVVYKASSLSSRFAHPIAHLKSAANGFTRWVGQKILR